MRYLPLLIARGADVVLEAALPLCRLFTSMQGVRVVPRGETIPPFDFHCPLLSLPLAFATTRETIPGDVPYLAAPMADMGAWGARIGGDPGLRVGLVWAPNLANHPGRHRTCPPEALAALAGMKAVRFYSLQKERPAGIALPPLALNDYTSELGDFAATAALVMQLDLVLTVDTAVAHLAAALGKPVWVLLPYERDWRWLAEGETTPWYPGMRLFQQARRGDWHGLLQRVAAELERFRDDHGARAH